MSDLLLHSSDHPTIDYTAAESKTSDAGEKHMKHYIALFDPVLNQLKVIEARRMTVRSSVRQLEAAPPDSDEDAETKPAVTNYSSRAALTQAFGTKKSKKAVQSIAENRLLARGADDVANNPLSNAILSSVPDEVAVDAEEPETPRTHKPLPPADLSTDDITQVYPLASLVFPGPAWTTLSQMPVAYWRDRISNKKEVKSTSRFVANRVAYLTKSHLASPSDESLLLNVQILRYIQLLIEISVYIHRLPRQRPIPQPEKWPLKTITESSSVSNSLLAKLTAHFFPNSLPTTHNTTLLHTTILALALHIPPPSLKLGVGTLVTEPTDLALDLALEQTQVRKLYRELGCKIESAKDSELQRWGLQKVIGKKIVDADGKETALPKPKFAKLSFPIHFPTVSQGRPSTRRR